MKYSRLIGCLLFTAGFAYCGTISSTFGPGGTFSLGVGFGVVGPAEIAYPFTVPAGSNYIFDSASLALSEGIGTNDLVTISLAANATGDPGSILENLVGTVLPFPNDTVPVTVTSSLNPLLNAGAVYWLILSPATGNGANWLTANILTNPDLQATRLSPVGAWTASPLLFGSNNPGAFSVDATAVSATPEGSTWCLVLTGIALLSVKRVCSTQQRA
jgi:hypothetical protein